MGFRFFTDGDWNPLFADPQFGIWQLLNGTFLITGDRAPGRGPDRARLRDLPQRVRDPRVRKVVKPILEVLVGVPTVVFGYFALTFVTPEILQALGIHVADLQRALGRDRDGHHDRPDDRLDLRGRRCARSPRGSARAPTASGSTKRQVATRVVFPAAISGIVASIVLGVSRGVGETMIVLLAAGLQPNFGVNPTEGYATITTFMGSAAEGDNPAGSIGYESIFACGLTLFVLTLVDEHDRDPVRAEVPGGLRVTAPPPPADAAAVTMPGRRSCATARPASRSSRSRPSSCSSSALRC